MQLSEELARTFAAMGRFLREREGDLAPTDVAVLARLAGQQCTRSRDLAQAEGLDPSTMSRRLASLAERGLVERHPDPADRRAQVLGLTEAGLAALTQERARRVELVTDTLADWPEAEKAQLADLLGRLADSLESARGTHTSGQSP
ncbi:MarR family winged helix-turn-helix transcriptional regulator [uncultured Serinicoccus sp.]|uniref:MarR family winged helix-turn-helix transcriptional regulator n=1 Tax=uncultured Serinicoccus sp. TaxID=735514 RepID=UPI002639B60E|nr:MarR family winged helix-turn-helix transcriptional regulator [uncultured Serinicoccus sp.]